jgi:hypothetical protein
MGRLSQAVLGKPDKKQDIDDYQFKSCILGETAGLLTSLEEEVIHGHSLRGISIEKLNIACRTEPRFSKKFIVDMVTI